MGELRHRVSPSECTVKQDMQRSRRQPFFTANHVGHLHQMVVYDVGQMVGRQFVGTLVKHLIVENGRVDDHIAANHVVHMYVLARLYLEADNVLPAFGRPPSSAGNDNELRIMPRVEASYWKFWISCRLASSSSGVSKAI